MYKKTKKKREKSFSIYNKKKIYTIYYYIYYNSDIL